MKLIPVRELRSKGAKVWEALREEHELVLTSNGQPIAILTSVNAENLDSQLKAARRTRAMLALERLWQEAKEKGVSDMSMEEIDEEIRAAREESAKKARRSRGEAS